MAISATARAQADEALDEAASALKRSLGVTRKALQAVRQAQANVKGVVIETHSPEEGIDHGSISEDPRA